MENRVTQTQFCDRIDADKTIAVRNTFLLWISFLACNCIRLFIRSCKFMCIYSLDNFYHQTCNLLFQSSIYIIFFRTCFCQIFYSQDNAEEVYPIGQADNPVGLQNWSLHIPTPPGNSINRRFLQIVLETVVNLQPGWLQAKHISRHTAATEWA